MTILPHTTNVMQIVPTRIARWIAPLTLVPAALAVPDVLEVGPGKTYAQIFDAAAAAVDGDVIIVASGVYEYFGIIGKGLTVVADGSDARIDGQVRIQDLGPNQSAILVGFTITGTGGTVGLTIANAQGPVRVDDCTIAGGISAAFVTQASVTIDSSADVVLSRCTVPFSWGWGAANQEDFSTGAIGVAIDSSYVLFEEVDITGGFGGESGSTNTAYEGVPAVTCRNSSLLARASTVTGGFAGGCNCFGWNFADGGYAIEGDTSSNLTIFDGALSAGLNSWFAISRPPIRGFATVTDWPGLAPRSDAPAIVREGDAALFEFIQQPLTRVDLLVSTNDGSVRLPALSGDLLVGAPFLRYRYIAGVTDANGSLQWTWTAPNLPASDAIVLRWQHAEIQTSGVVTLGRMHVMTVLDPAF